MEKHTYILTSINGLEMMKYSLFLVEIEKVETPLNFLIKSSLFFGPLIGEDKWMDFSTTKFSNVPKYEKLALIRIKDVPYKITSPIDKLSKEEKDNAFKEAAASDGPPFPSQYDKNRTRKIIRPSKKEKEFLMKPGELFLVPDNFNDDTVLILNGHVNKTRDLQGEFLKSILLTKTDCGPLVNRIFYPGSRANQKNSNKLYSLKTSIISTNVRFPPALLKISGKLKLESSGKSIEEKYKANQPKIESNILNKDNDCFLFGLSGIRDLGSRSHLSYIDDSYIPFDKNKNEKVKFLMKNFKLKYEDFIGISDSLGIKNVLVLPNCYTRWDYSNLPFYLIPFNDAFNYSGSNIELTDYSAKDILEDDNISVVILSNFLQIKDDNLLNDSVEHAAILIPGEKPMSIREYVHKYRTLIENSRRGIK